MKTLAVWLVMLAIISLMPGAESQDTLFPGADKVAHVVLYAITCTLFAVVLREHKSTSRRFLDLAIVFSVAYGYLMEIAQGTLTTTRMFSHADAAANAVGAILGGLYVWFELRRRARRNTPLPAHQPHSPKKKKKKKKT